VGGGSTPTPIILAKYGIFGMFNLTDWPVWLICVAHIVLYFITHCFNCRPSDTTVLENARTLSEFAFVQSELL
jgi:hypothetical protein